MSYFKKKQFIALVAKLKMPGQPVQRASSRKRRDGARNLGQEAGEDWGAPVPENQHVSGAPLQGSEKDRDAISTVGWLLRSFFSFML